MRTLLLGLLALSLACSAASKKPLSDEDSLGGFGDDDPPLPPPHPPDSVDDDSGAFDLGTRESDAGAPDGATGRDDAGVVTDASAPSVCSGALKAGDVKVVEIMIASASGSGDKGEWVEIQSTRACTLNLKGLRVESPRGTGTDTATIATDFFLKPYDMATIADSTSSADSHITTTVPAAFNASDVLKNDGDTISVYSGTTTIDTITYPKFTLQYGKSVSFPWDCSWSDRSSWSRWSWSSASYYGTTLKGTPDKDNTDVACY